MSAVVWISFFLMMLFVLHVTRSCIALFFSFIPKHLFLLHLYVCSFLSFLLWHPRNPFLRRTRYLVVVLPLLLLSILETGSVIQNLKRILRRIFVTNWFIRNGKLLCPIFQTLLYSMCLAVGVGNLSVRNPLNVPACLYRSSTPKYMLSITLSLSLLWYIKEHIS